MSHELRIFLGIIIFLILQRFYELYLTFKNHKWLVHEFGAIEVGVGQRKAMIVMHISWFISLLVEAKKYGELVGVELQLLCFSLLIFAQLLRLHSMYMLGNLWSTRVYRFDNPIVCRDGIFKYIKHPNYLAVILEFIVVPLHFGLWRTLVIFSILNLIFLFKRMKLEENVLGAQLAQWRFLPRLY